MIFKKATELHNAWNRFWFESDGAAQMALFRKFFALLWFVIYLVKAIDVKLWYTDAGLMPLSAVHDFIDMEYRYSLFFWFGSEWVIWAFQGLFLLALLSLAFGVLPRVSALICFVLHLSFMRRNMSIAYGVDLISVFFFFSLCFANYQKSKGNVRSLLGSVAYRLCQIQVCVIYFYSGAEKIRGPLWWRGEALWSVFANFQIARFKLDWIAHFPLLIFFLTVFTVLWETFFPALIWVKPIKYPVLMMGVLLHIGIALSIILPFFGLLMIVSYSLFLDKADAEKWNKALGKCVKLFKVYPPDADQSYV